MKKPSEASGDSVAKKAKTDTKLSLSEAARSGFARVFAPALPSAYAVAPGRVEVIGNHTDYNEGFILAAAIDSYVVISGGRAEGCECAVQSRSVEQKFDEQPERKFDEVKCAPVVRFTYEPDTPFSRLEGDAAWANYVVGTLEEFRKRGIKLGGIQMFIDSNVPVGSGVSSSAALEMATAKLVMELFPKECVRLSQLDAVKMCKSAENNFVGMGCGILDQFSSGMGKSGHLVFLDCRDLSYEHVEFSSDVVFLLANTNAPHQLVDGQYNKLRACCEEAALFFKAQHDPSITHLRDVSSETFEAKKDGLAPEVQPRAKHIVHENERVLDSVKALKAGDHAKLGELMRASHASSSVDFRNSCFQLDAMIAAAEGLDGWLGGRLMGGGFGGCTINLCEATHMDHISSQMTERYQQAVGIRPDILLVRPGDAASSGKY